MRFLFGCFLLLNSLSALVVEIVLEGDATSFNSHIIEPTDIDHPYWFMAMRARLEKLGHTVIAKEFTTIGNPDVLIFENNSGGPDITKIRRLPGKKVLLIKEPPVVVSHIHELSYLYTFDKVVSFRDDLPKLSDRFIHFCFDVKDPMPAKLPSFSERDFSCMVLGNKHSKHPEEIYSERLRLIEYYETTHPLAELFHLYGQAWAKCLFSCYRGTPSSQFSVMKNHKFVFAFENWDNDVGYITEKIFSAFEAGAIPIYYGASNIESYIPDGCYINFRQFKSYHELHTFLTSIDETLWNLLQNNIRNFLESEASEKFNRSRLAEALVSAVLECAP